MNVQLLVFAVSWFGLVRMIFRILISWLKLFVIQGEIDFPKDDKTFLDIISRLEHRYPRI